MLLAKWDTDTEPLSPAASRETVSGDFLVSLCLLETNCECEALEFRIEKIQTYTINDGPYIYQVWWFILCAHLAEDVVRGAWLAQPVVAVLRRPRAVGVAPVELVHPGHHGGEQIWRWDTRFYNTLTATLCVD